LVSSPRFIRNQFFCASKRPASFRAQRRAVKEDELHAELEQQIQRDEARRRLSHLQQPLADQRRAQLQQRFADLAVHLAQRYSASSRTCAKIRQRRQHQGQAHEAPGPRACARSSSRRSSCATRSLRVRCTAALAPAPAPVALTFNCPLPASGDHPPTSTRPPPTRTAIRAARRSSANGLWGQGQGWRHVSCGCIACG